MLETIAIILFLFWLLGVMSSFMAGGFIHILLAVSIVTSLVSLIQNKRQ